MFDQGEFRYLMREKNSIIPRIDMNFKVNNRLACILMKEINRNLK